jgi:serine phosphatase RsbU (regulator of sigma subunit)
VREIAETVATNAGVFLGARSARVFVLGDDDVLRSTAFYGTDVESPVRYEALPMEADLPGPLAVRTGQPVFLRNLDQIAKRFPELAGVYPSERSLHVAPLIVGDHRLGVLSLAFPASGDFDEETQLAFVRALADALAQALERALALERAAETRQRLTLANERLAFLADASVALSRSLDYQATLDAVTQLLVPRFADWCAVQVLADGELQNVALLHSDPEKVAWAQQMSGRYPTNMDSSTGGPNVIRTGQSELFPEIPDELIERAAVNEDHLAIIRELGMSSAMVVPLSGRSGTFGVVTLIYAESGRRYAPADLPFVEDVARRAALALETAGTFREQSGRLADVTRVAEAAQLAILAPPPDQIGPVALAARYVSAASEAQIGGDLYEVVARPGAVRLLIGDVRGKGLAAVRTATIVLGEFRAAAADLDDLAEAMKHIDRRLRPYLGEEDFVTALAAEISYDGRFAVAACGHPPALLASHGVIREVDVGQSLPLGLGASPTVVTGTLRASDRLLLHTDGVLEARDSERRFVDLMQLASPLRSGTDLSTVLDDVLRALHDAVGRDLGDDVALLVAEYRGR